jgi:uncharacterized protein YkwD
MTMALAPAGAHAAGQPVSRAAATADSVELAEVRMINAFRVQHGLSPLHIDGTLTRTAGWMSTDMGTHHRFSHTDSRGRDPFQRMRAFGYPSATTWRGENIAAGNATAGATYLQWLNSPPHRANWLNGRFHAIGISRVRVPGSPYGYYWTTTFGSKWTGPAR